MASPNRFCWLGGVPVTHGDRRHGPGYIPQPLAVRDTTSPTSGLNISSTKTTVKMSPNMACEALLSFSPRLSVAKRKEALELRKVSEATDLFSHTFMPTNVIHDERILMMCSFQTMKPLMEKRRRARINDSLNHLKNLILPLTDRDVSYCVSV